MSACNHFWSANKGTQECLYCHATRQAPSELAPARLLDDALRITMKISEEYSRLCSVMHSMPFRRSELKAGERFMDALENLRDEILKRKSSNEKGQA